jgi:Transposase DDE domain
VFLHVTLPISKKVTVASAQSAAPSSRDRFDALRDRLRGQAGLPFLDLLCPRLVEDLARRCNHRWRNRVYTPWITLSLFLSQVLADDQSCTEAVDRLQKYRADRGLDPVATETGSYCEARDRLPEGLAWELVRQTGHTIHQKAEGPWLFYGRPVKIPDGSTVSLPDTEANHAAYPQQTAQAPGLGFPIARILVVFSLAVGTVLEATLGPYQGKETGELALLRQIIGQFQPGDIALADRLFGTYWAIAAWQRRGVDVVTRLHQRRQADFRRGRRLGPDDHVVTWTKPQEIPEWMSRDEYEAMPATLSLREIRLQVRDKSKRVRTVVLVTTLLDATVYPAAEIRALYRQRWHAELDLRSLKATMRMDVLRGKSPEMVRKEVAMHLLAYNLIRGIMAEAARVSEVKPRQLSFKGAQQTIRSFEEGHLYDPRRIKADLPRLLHLIGRKRVGKRPDRYEPRAIKRRPKPHRLLQIPRAQARRRIARGIIIDDKV